MRELQWRPTILNRITQQDWEDGRVRWILREKAHRKALDIMANHKPEPLSAELKAKIDGWSTHTSRQASERHTQSHRWSLRRIQCQTNSTSR